MRIKINFRPGGNKVLPINYKYELSSWIYKTLYTGNPEFAGWLHQQGYSYQSKKFKLFTFSDLYGFNYQVNGDRIKILSDNLSLIISFYIDKAVMHFIEGIFKEQEFELGDKKSKVQLSVATIEKLKKPDFNEPVRFKTLSPVILTKVVDENGKLKTKYISPFEEDYALRLKNNLINKFKSLSERNGLDEDALNLKFEFKAGSAIRRKKITIKAHTPEQTELIGYQFEFTLNADLGLMELAYYSGFGEKNSLGFGCVEILKESKP